MVNTIQIKKRTAYGVIGMILAIAGLLVIIMNQPMFQKISTTSLPTVSPTNYEPVRGPQEKVTLEINEGTYEFVKGRETQVFSYNNQMPGPLITGTVGETIEVLVKNNLDEPTTVHWHGLQVENLQDGVPQVTQEPISPGEEFTYSLRLVDPGLYWYHSHVDAHKQVESGLQGTLLVKPENSQKSEGTILVLDDVLLQDSYQLTNFNVGVMHGRFGNLFLVNGQVNPSIDLENNRLRIVNTANARSFTLSFGSVPFTVIGQDIGHSQFYTDTQLLINPGERYDILLDTQEVENLKLTYLTSRGNYELATLDYNGNDISDQFEEEFKNPSWLDEAQQMEPTFQADLVGFMAGHMNLVWSINRKSYPDNPEIFEATEGDIVTMRIRNTQGQPHPMHLHGQKFIVLKRNGIVQEKLGWKDTVMVKGGETVDIAFRAEEKGEWVFHCHILEHAEAGMLSVVKVV